MKRTTDGFICYENNRFESGLETLSVTNETKSIDDKDYDVIIIGAGFAGLIAARELSQRDRSVLIIEAKDRIGGRTFTAQVNNDQYEIGGTWVHWSQPHLWAEITRYGLSLCESDGAVAEQITLLLDHGTKLKTISSAELYPKLFTLMNEFSNVDGVQGRTVFPLPHTPLANLQAINKFDHLSMQDRLDQIANLFDNDDEMRQILDAYLSMNTQGDLAKSSFLDHLCFWTLGDRDTNQTWDKTSRYKIREGTSVLARAILDDCQNVNLLFSTSVKSIHRTNDQQVIVRTETGRAFRARTTIVTVPLNALHCLEFQPELNSEKQRAIDEGQCRGGLKFWAKLKTSIGNWCGFAPYPNPITVAYTDDKDGTIIVGFGPDDTVDIRNSQALEHELQKFLPNCQIECVFGHDWRSDPSIKSTWSWYKPGQISSNLRALQMSEPPLFFASGDASSSWRGCIDGALESGLTAVRHVQNYLLKNSSTNL